MQAKTAHHARPSQCKFVSAVHHLGLGDAWLQYGIKPSTNNNNNKDTIHA